MMDDTVKRRILQPGETRQDRPRKTALELGQAWAVIGLFLIVAIAALHYAGTILMPLALAVVVGLILGLAADRLEALGVPPMLSAIVLTTALAALVTIIGNTLAGPLMELAQDMPAIGQTMVDRFTPFLQRFHWLHLDGLYNARGVTMDKMLENGGGILTTVAGQVTPAIVQTLIFFVGLVLFLAGRVSIRKTLIVSFRDRARRLAAIRCINAIETALGFYFATASLIYAGVGCCAMLIAWAGGLTLPVLWGFFAFLSSFVPFLGVTAITVSLALAGILTHSGLLFSLLPAIAFFTVHTLVENLVTPAVMGRRMEINAFAVFVAIIFWTWVWGAAGAMLAVPLSLIGKAIFAELAPHAATKPKLPG
ncbi:AI-2E family transporter [Allorhizobium taibaishanense]|uniref:AI-2E family transporter n=1 Tax=Allorhizobium taibaishanense TaxID=887144 RepID=A0A1Q8ZZP6_9HYPH|nr:AI-2E family transporter [Allorhizobium taibaishanense]MBB4007226.1 putative PurR-regulated permease PerM [Allorhizobium taibaishanense]OLP47767.1 AI-2E family transporter [Allorhizobium taibaishanense]